MLQESSGTSRPRPVCLSENPADRRAHPRIPLEKLPVTRVHIPHRATVSLVDLSSGGALLQLPFQMQPEARFAVKIDTPVEQLEVPIQLLRCYVAELKDGVTYHAAGAFDSLLNLQALAQRASSAAQRLLAALERLQNVVRKAAAQSHSDAAFEEILSAVIAGMRRGESLDLVTLKVKAHLTQTHPSLMIMETLAPLRDQSKTVQAFGLTFTSKFTLSASTRRLLKANAQLISMLEETRREVREELEPQSPEVIYSAAEWLRARPAQTFTPAAPRRIAKRAPQAPEADDNWRVLESLIRKAAVL
jgi:hypothetical protein